VGHAGYESDAERFGGAKDPIVVVRGAEVEGCRCAAAQEFDDSELGCRFDAITVESCLVRPGAKPEPVEELETVRLMPEQRLYDVDVALDKAREHRRTTGVEDLGGIAFGSRMIGNGRYAAVADCNVS
jgi:hypothetical protein